MKKLLIALILLISAISFMGCYEVTPVTTEDDIELELSFVLNKKYSLTTGVISNDTDYAITERQRFYSDLLTVNDYDNISYILFWNDNNYFIGFYTVRGEVESGTKYLDTNLSYYITPPTGATKIAFMTLQAVIVDELINLIEDPNFTLGGYSEGDLPNNFINYDNVNVFFDENYWINLQPNTYDVINFSCSTTSTPSLWGYDMETYEFILGHKYFLDLHVKSFFVNSIDGYLKVYTYDNGLVGNDDKGDLILTANKNEGTSHYNYDYTYTIEDIVTISTENQNYLLFEDTDITTATDGFILLDWGLYDLTDLFHSGNEPSIEDFRDILDSGETYNVEYGITLENFLDLEVIETRILDITDPQDVDEFINNNVIYTLGLDTQGGQLLFLTIVIIITILLLFIFKASVSIVIIIVMIELLIGYGLEWLDAWIILLITMLMFGMLMLRLIKGRG